MNVVLLLAAIIAAVVLALGVYIEAREHRDAAQMRDALGLWHDSTSGDPVDVEYREDK